MDKHKRNKDTLMLEQAVEISTANENCEGDNWSYMINLCGDADILFAQYEARIAELEAAINKTLEKHGHLADGEDCTLIDLVKVMGGGE